jgi:hypothetical protein
VGSPCKEPVSILGPSSVLRLPRNIAVSAGVLEAVSLLTALLLFDGLAVVSRHRFFLEDTMIVYRARKSV